MVGDEGLEPPAIAVQNIALPGRAESFGIYARARSREGNAARCRHSRLIGAFCCPLHWRTTAMGAPAQQAATSLWGHSTPLQYRVRIAGPCGRSRRLDTPLRDFTSVDAGTFAGYS